MSFAPQKHSMPKVGFKEPRSYHGWYHSRLWRKMRLVQLEKQPLCEICQKEGTITPATEVDHKLAHRGEWSLFSDASNLQSACKPCHSAKSARGE